LEQIPGVLDKTACVGVILSGSSKPARGVLDTDLPDLIGRVKTPVFAGGKTAVSHQVKLEQAGVNCLGENITAGLQLVTRIVTADKSR
jgi:hypothetical protein